MQFKISPFTSYGKVQNYRKTYANIDHIQRK